MQAFPSNVNERMEVYFVVKEILHSNLLAIDSAVHNKRFRKHFIYMFDASTIGEDSRKEVLYLSMIWIHSLSLGLIPCRRGWETLRKKFYRCIEGEAEKPSIRMKKFPYKWFESCSGVYILSNTFSLVKNRWEKAKKVEHCWKRFNLVGLLFVWAWLKESKKIAIGGNLFAQSFGFALKNLE